MVLRTFLLAICFITFLNLSNCGKDEQKPKKLEDGVTEKKKVRLSEILAKPDDYNGKEVVLEGNFGGSCCATDFFYKEGVDTIEVYPQNFSIPDLKKGALIRVYGTVNVIRKKRNIEGVDVEDVEVTLKATKIEER